MVLYHTTHDRQDGPDDRQEGNQRPRGRCHDAATRSANGRALGRYLFAIFISGNVCALGYLWTLWDHAQADVARQGGQLRRHQGLTPAVAELTTVADDEAVVHDGSTVRRYDGLAPDTDHEIDGFAFRTLPDLGERLATFATVNDVHFGEEVCGVIDGLPDGPVFSVAPGTEPYPEVMNRGAIDGDGRHRPRCGRGEGRPHLRRHRRGVRRVPRRLRAGLRRAARSTCGATTTPTATRPTRRRARSASTSPGVTLALLDTTIPGHTTGQVPDEQLEWLDDLAGRRRPAGAGLRPPPRVEPRRQRSGRTATSASTPTTPSA